MYEQLFISKFSEYEHMFNLYYSDVNCISCDKEVVMHITTGLHDIPAKDGVQPIRSIRPYLTYKLDQVRKQQER